MDTSSSTETVYQNTGHQNAKTAIFIVTCCENLTALHLLLSTTKAFPIIFRVMYVVIWELDSRVDRLLNISHYGESYFHYPFSMNALIANTKYIFNYFMNSLCMGETIGRSFCILYCYNLQNFYIIQETHQQWRLQ